MEKIKTEESIAKQEFFDRYKALCEECGYYIESSDDGGVEIDKFCIDKSCDDRGTLELSEYGEIRFVYKKRRKK